MLNNAARGKYAFVMARSNAKPMGIAWGKAK